MLGIRLKPEDEKQLDRQARALGMPKSALVREWIKERLQRDSIDEEMRIAARLHAGDLTSDETEALHSATDEWLRALDREDGGYDWGPNGPPA